MMVDDIEQKIRKLSLVDFASSDEQSSNNLNQKIENLFGEVSLNSNHDKILITFSPATLKA